MMVLGIVVLFVGLFASVRQRHRLRRARRAARLRRRVHPRPAVRARDEQDHLGTAPAHQGHDRHTRPGERGAEPEAHRDDRDRADHRRRAGRLHHDLRGVGEGIDRARDRLAVQHRLRRARTGWLLARHRPQPEAGTADRGAARGPGRNSVARRCVRTERQPQLPLRDRPEAGRRAVRPRQRLRLALRSHRHRHRGLEEGGRRPQLEARRRDPGHVREDRQPEAARRLHLQGEHVRRLLHLDRQLREELRRPARQLGVREPEARRVARGGPQGDRRGRQAVSERQGAEQRAVQGRPAEPDQRDRRR